MTFYLGSGSYRFDNLYLYANDLARMMVQDGTYGDCWMSTSVSSTANVMSIGINAGTEYFIAFTNQFSAVPSFIPNLDLAIDLGTSSYAWDDIYYDDLHNEADYFYLDSIDDLEELHKIKGSGIIDERTGLELIDDDTIPKFLLSKAKCDIRESKDKPNKLKYKKGDILYSSRNRPLVSLKAIISHLQGCIRQLDNKVETLKKQLASR